MRIQEMELSKQYPTKPGTVLMIWMTVFFFVATLVFNYLQSADTEIFESDIGDVASKYELDVSPAGWTFTIWAFIYAAQAIMLLYILTLTCRRNPLSRGKLYHDPPFLPPTFFAIYMLSCICNVAWLFAFDSEYLIGAMVALIAITLCLYLCIIFAVRLLYKYEPDLGRKELLLNVVLVHNALGLYATWTTIASMLNIGIVLFYEGDFSMTVTCWAVLIPIATLLVLYFLLDMFAFTVSLRYVFTPYIVVIVACAGIITENLDWDVDYQLLVVAILAAAVLMLLVKVVVSLVRAIRTPSPLEIED